MNAKLLASAEIQKYEAGLPTKILYIWHEEDRALLLEMKNPKINTSLIEDNWKMPTRLPQLNMAEDVFQTSSEPSTIEDVYLKDIPTPMPEKLVSVKENDEKTQNTPATQQ